MTLDDRIRVALFIIFFLLLFPLAVYRRVKAHATGEKLDRRQEGSFILFTLRPLGFSMMLGFLAWMVNPSWMSWSSITLPGWARWLGVGLGLLSGALLLWAFQSLGKNLTDTVAIRRDHYLVTSGPYAFIRHPFYDSVALFILSIALSAANWFFMLAGVLFFSLISIRTAKEEANLMARFGEAYRTYIQQTGRFLPKLSRNH
jgi:protein-S-isoprenylcysteine O-methyltransferase Ste14